MRLGQLVISFLLRLHLSDLPQFRLKPPLVLITFEALGNNREAVLVVFGFIRFSVFPLIRHSQSLSQHALSHLLR